MSSDKATSTFLIANRGASPCSIASLRPGDSGERPDRSNLDMAYLAEITSLTDELITLITSVSQV